MSLRDDFAATQDECDAQSFVSAVESEGTLDSDMEDGDLDDLEYLTLDLVNVLPTKDWQHLLELLRSRQEKTTDLTNENESLKTEVRSLRRLLRKQGSVSGTPQHDAKCTAALTPQEQVLREDLERRVAAMAAERRGQGTLDAMDEDLREAAEETLRFLSDSTAAAESLPKLLAMLTQYLVWATRAELAPRGATSVLTQVPEATLQAAWERALEVAEENAGRTTESPFADLPDSIPIVLAALSELPTNSHAQRVGLACVAMCTFSAQGRLALLDKGASGLRQVLAAAAGRARHPEIQKWALAAIANTAPDLSQDSSGPALAWEASGLSITALRSFRTAPEVLERAAHALAALLYAQPRRSGQAAQAKQVVYVLQELTERFDGITGSGPLLRQLAEATKALKQASALGDKQ